MSEKLNDGPQKAEPRSGSGRLNNKIRDQRSEAFRHAYHPLCAGVAHGVSRRNGKANITFI